ncbi:MAG: hypothetical protein DM484_30260 [Candidatus Methylumidiphilus alinenensis]|uniref:Uncharacterized protein n=1 Tax=Candidatus Methylumidiphilus alinenensis TaxID=2202197 RepID=A0A2W4QD83_9GAMM|nr:MAG: hypothetical protein DM484_30260 [Candidatus Methylumidiphilus alinenensis]
MRGGALLQAALLVMKYIFQDELPERLPGILGLTGNTVDLRKTPSFRHGPPEPRLQMDGMDWWYPCNLDA